MTEPAEPSILPCVANNGVRHSSVVRETANQLRRTGHSLNDISRILGVSKSTASLWSQEVTLQSEATTSIANKRIAGVRRAGKGHRARAEDRRRRWQAEAEDFWLQHKSEPLFMLGLGLYWGEGSKRGQALSLVNSDLGLVRNWVHWLSVYLPDVPLHGALHLHGDQSTEAALKFWSEGLPYPGHVSVRLIPPKRNVTRRLQFGTFVVLVGVGSTEWHYKMLHWLDCLAIAGSKMSK